MICRFKFVHMMTTVIVVLNLVGMLIFNICYDTVYSNCSEMGYIEQIVYSWVYISCLVILKFGYDENSSGPLQFH